MRNTKFIVALIILSACSHRAGSQAYTMVHDGATRSYIVHLPTGYTATQKYPLVLNLHGLGESNIKQEHYSHMDDVADSGHFIVVYPEGVNKAWNAGIRGPRVTKVDDVGFISALLDTLEAKYSIDAKRIYSCGISNGGFMSYRLACELSNRIAAIASVAGQLTDFMKAACRPSRPVAIMQIHGTDDELVNYEGALGYGPVDSLIHFWLWKDNCKPTPVITKLPDTDTTDGCTVTKYDYVSCSGGSEVALYKIINGGHTWPGGYPVSFLGKTDEDFNASEEIWKFFKGKSL